MVDHDEHGSGDTRHICIRDQDCDVHCEAKRVTSLDRLRVEVHERKRKFPKEISQTKIVNRPFTTSTQQNVLSRIHYIIASIRAW